MSLSPASAARWRRFASTKIVALVILAQLGIASWLAAAPGADCGWAVGLHRRDFDIEVHDFVIWDDGTGPALYAAGCFEIVEDVEAFGVARWDGRHWWPLHGSGGGGLQGIDWVEGMALAVWDDGTGEALYIGGYFASADGTTASNIARWDGTDWSALVGASGEGVNYRVEALHAWDDGLYVGGNFSQAAGMSAERVARWDGTEWASLDIGTDGTVYALEVWDDGRGPALYAGGSLYEAGGLEASGVARWDKTVWEDLDVGIEGTAYALAVYNGELAVGGDFTAAGSAYDPAEMVAIWDGTSWSAASTNTFSDTVFDLEVWHDGGTSWLYAAGSFDVADGQPAQGLARWDGLSWSPAAGAGGPGFFGLIMALEVWDDGSGEALWLGGDFWRLGDLEVGSIGLWDGATFGNLASTAGGMDAQVDDFVAWDDGTGLKLFAVGSFNLAGAGESRGVARWDGRVWTPLPGLPYKPWPGHPDNPMFNAIHVYSGALYVGGVFTEIDGITMNNIARWDGTAWSALTGPSGTGTDEQVKVLFVWDDGGGEDLYMAGSFDKAGGTAAARIARWDGAEFSALGSGLDNFVTSLTAWDAGGGDDLYVGGAFLTAGGLTVNRVARWDGAAWSDLTGASGTGTSGNIHGLTVFQGSLHVAGNFTTAGGVTVNDIATWDGVDWTPLIDGGGAIGVNRTILNMTSHDDGSGAALVISTGNPNGAGAVVDRVAQWDGTDWSDLNQPVAGPDSAVYSLESLDLGAGPFLAAGGAFDRAGGAFSSHIGLWSCDSVPPGAPFRLESTSHVPGVPSAVTVIDIEWESSSDAGPLGLWGDSWLFDQVADTEPDERIENLAAAAAASASSEELPVADDHWFHLKTCDRNRNCTVSHLGPFAIEAGGSEIFIDSFESGDTSAWSEVVQ